MKKILLILAIMVTMTSHAFGFATLATTFKGGDPISFNSNTQDVDIYLNNQMIGKYTNNTFILHVQRDGQPKVFSFKKTGYKDAVITLTTSFDKMFWGNLLIGGSFGSSTDSWFTNNTQEYSPNQFFIQMEKS